VAIASSTGLTKFGLMTTLLTTESLLFAALSVGLSLAAAAPFGRAVAVRPGVLALAAAAVLTFVGVAAVLAWCDLFLGAHWPKGSDGQIEAIALLCAIIAQPVFAGVLAIGIARG
jgi:hypothetical protein